MKIDVRLFIIPAAPFVVLALARVLWFVAGAEWSDPTFAAVISVILGLTVGGVITIFLLMEDISLGHIRIGKDRGIEK